MKTFRTIGDKQLRRLYSISIEERDGTGVVYFNSKVHVNKRTKIGPDYSSEFTYEEILRDVLPYAVRKFGPEIVHCPDCGGYDCHGGTVPC